MNLMCSVCGGDCDFIVAGYSLCATDYDALIEYDSKIATGRDPHPAWYETLVAHQEIKDEEL